MSATAALVQRFITAVNTRDASAAAACCDEDIAHDGWEGQRSIGADALRHALAERASALDETIADAVVMTDAASGRAAVEFTARGTYRTALVGLPKATGQTYALTAVMTLEIDDGRIVRLSEYRSLPAWAALLAK